MFLSFNYIMHIKTLKQGLNNARFGHKKLTPPPKKKKLSSIGIGLSKDTLISI